MPRDADFGFCSGFNTKVIIVYEIQHGSYNSMDDRRKDKVRGDSSGTRLARRGISFHASPLPLSVFQHNCFCSGKIALLAY
jgi:hypothetical protein